MSIGELSKSTRSTLDAIAAAPIVKAREKDKGMALSNPQLAAPSHLQTAEKEFYDRRPTNGGQSTHSVAAADGSTVLFSGHALRSGTKTADGDVLVHGRNEHGREAQIILKPKDLEREHAKFEKNEADFADKYKRWHDEGMKRGMIAGSPNERP